MNLSLKAFLLVALTKSVDGFVVRTSNPSTSATFMAKGLGLPLGLSLRSKESLESGLSLRMSSSEDEFDLGPRKNSRFEGNQREPTVQEISVMDDMITKLMDAKPYELPNAVSKAIRVVSSPRFFMRIAERADTEIDPVKKERLGNLATNLVTTIEAVVSTTEEKLDDRAKVVEDVVKAAAQPDSGEFLVPLSTDRVDAMRQALNKINPLDQDEGFLSTIDAWMNKSHEDGLDGMVAILQKVLQIYAGEAIARARLQLQSSVAAAVVGENQAKVDEIIAENEKTPATELMNALMVMDTDVWDVEIRKAISKEDGGVTSGALMGEVQKTMEAVVLGLESGSMAQRVQAEYLKELVTRIEQLK